MNTNPTLFDNVNQVINALAKGIMEIFGEDLVGIYLFGSLSYGDFNLESSDIDLTVILEEPSIDTYNEKLKLLHKEVERQFPSWAERIEVSYTPRAMLSEINPPGSRPYYGEGKFYYSAKYGNEWIINLYLLYNHGIQIVGPEFKELVRPINITDVQAAAKKDLFQEWEPKLKDPDWLDNPHYQSYLIMNLCRIFNTIVNGEAVSKKKSAAWVKEQYSEWEELINEAEVWHYGLPMDQKEKALEFLKFVIDKVS